MRTKFKLLFVLLMISAQISFSSCNKDDQSDGVVKTRTELITSAPWKRTALISDPAYDWNVNGVFDTDVLKTMFACERDNLDIYNTNGIIETNEGPTKCNSTDPQSWTSTWTFAENETKLIFGGSDIYTLIELTETTLKYQSTFVEDGITYTHVETYGH